MPDSRPPPAPPSPDVAPRPRRSRGRYLELARGGELTRRAEALRRLLSPCRLCPRACGVDRLGDAASGSSSQGATAEVKLGRCGAGRWARLAAACAHRGEEPVISGARGAGTLFFVGCNLRCVFCQNHAISQPRQAPAPAPAAPSGAPAPALAAPSGAPSPALAAPSGALPRGSSGWPALDAAELAAAMLQLQADGAHNVELVSPSHLVPQAVEALEVAARQGLTVPLVYNSNGFEGLEALRLLDGIVDVYLPDLKYGADEPARRYSAAPGYVGHAVAALAEMKRQVGDLRLDAEGVARQGLLVRHLVLPGDLGRAREALRLIADELGRETWVSVMAQYYPAHHAPQVPRLARGLSPAEYDQVLQWLDELGLEHGFVQELESEHTYRPDFHRPGHPFES